MKTFTIFCDGGLGNRLSVLIGGFLFAEKFNRKVIICWPENNWCGCSFNDVFDYNESVINLNINELFYKNLNNKFIIHENQTDYKIQYHLPNFENYNLFSSNQEDNLIYYNNSIPDFFNLEQVLETLKKFKIKSDVIDKVFKFCNDKNINTETRGIHFRKTDFKNFLNEDDVYSLISSKPNTNYFICSDCSETEKRFNTLHNVNIFPKNNYVEKFKDGNWNDLIKDKEGREFDFNVKRSKESVIEGFVDLLILSRTKIIIESRSTFLKFAKLYSSIDLFLHLNK